MKYIEVLFCAGWGYQPQAASVAEEIEKEYPQVEVECEPGSGGVFDVIIDNKVIFTKKNTGRFPERGEIVKLIKETQK